MVNDHSFNEDQTVNVNEGRNLMSICLLIHTLIRRCSVLSGVSACRRVAVSCLLGLAFLAGVASEAMAQLSFPVRSGIGAFTTFTYVDLYYPLGGPITPIELIAAGGGTGKVEYTLEHSELGATTLGTALEVLGLEFNSDTRMLTGTPKVYGHGVASDGYMFTYTAEDENGQTAQYDVYFTFCLSDSDAVAAGTAFCRSPQYSDSPLTFPPDGPMDRTFGTGEAITPITLPAGTGGTGANVPSHEPTYFYRLLDEPAWVEFDGITRVMTGTPPQDAGGATTVRYQVSEAGTAFLETAERTFMITVIPPSLSEVENRAFTVGDQIEPVTLPALADGNGNITYLLFGPDGTEETTNLPDWLKFDVNTRIVTGRPDEATPDEGVTLTYTATDSSTTAQMVSQMFTITVSPVSLGEVENRTFTAGDQIEPVTLPEITGGFEPFTYTLTGPEDASLGDTIPGLMFNADADTRMLTGEPEAATPAEGVMLTYKVTDNNSNEAEQTFTVTVISASFNEVNNALLPEIARAMADSTTSAISRRIEQANLGQASPEQASLGQANLGQASPGQANLGQAGADDSASVNIGGQNGLAEALTTHGKAVTEGERDFKTLLAGSDFVLPLAAAGNGVAVGGLSSLALWGSGEFRNLDNRHGSVSWDGNLVGAHAGIDGRLRQNLLLGVAVSWHQSDLDYKLDADDRGKHELSVISAHPYVGWNSDSLDLWATAGYGQGDLDITPAGGDKGSSDVNLLTAGMGLVSPLAQSDILNLRTRGEVVWSQLEAEGSSTIDKLKVDTTRLRLTLEASRSFLLPDGSRLEPTLEAGVRHDGGDGLTGSGFESGIGMRYYSPDSRVTAEGRSRILIGRSGDLDEWGVQGQILVTPGTDGQGFSFSLAPGYGDSNSTVRQVWQRDLADNLAGDNEGGADDYRMHLNTRLGYGFIMPGYNGVLTPYSEVALSDATTYGLGMNWALASGVDLTLHGERREETNADAEHSILLKGAMRF